MRSKVRKDLIDVNGHATHRMVNDVNDVSAEAMAEGRKRAAQVPTATATSPRSFEGIFADAQRLARTNHYEHAFAVTLEHEGSERSIQVPYSHLSENEPSAQSVLGHLAFEARAYTHHSSAEAMADTFGLSTVRGPDGQSEADIAYANFKSSHESLKDLLGDDYKKVTKQALGKEPFRSPFRADIEQGAVQLSSFVDGEARKAYDKGDLKSYGLMKAASLGMRALSAMSASDGKFNDRLTKLERTADELEEDGHRAGWRTHYFAHLMRAQAAADRGEPYDVLPGRSAGDIPEMDSAADQMRQQSRVAADSGDVQLMTSLDYWSEQYAKFRTGNDPAETLLDTAADMMRESKALRDVSSMAMMTLGTASRDLMRLVRLR